MDDDFSLNQSGAFMNKKDLYEILKETVRGLNQESDLFAPLPPLLDEASSLDAIGLDPILLPDVLQNLKMRFGGRDLGSCLDYPSALVTLGDFLNALTLALGHGIAAPCMVYVDDEESNLFVFKRRFDKHFSIKYFSDPSIALDFIWVKTSMYVVSCGQLHCLAALPSKLPSDLI